MGTQLINLILKQLKENKMKLLKLSLMTVFLLGSSGVFAGTEGECKGNYSTSMKDETNLKKWNKRLTPRKVKTVVRSTQRPGDALQ
jgi:hypothetical protein